MTAQLYPTERSLIIRPDTLDGIQQPEALTPHLERPPSPQPYTIRSVANTHYLIEKEGLPIWIEKDECWLGSSASDSEDEKATAPKKRIFTPREILFITNVCLAQHVSLAALAQTFAPLIDLSRFYNINEPGLIAWPTASYSLTLGSCILPSARLGDMYGHKKMVIIGWVWFSVTSVACGFSQYGTIQNLTPCRALQGIGPALLVPNGLALFGRNFPMGVKRNVEISLFGGSGPLGVVTGAVFSSLIAETASWPWSFWVLSTVAALISVLSYLVIPADNLPPHLDLSKKSRKHFDFLGAFTGVGGLILINFALNQAPLVNWSNPYIGVTLGLGVILIAAFVYVELVVAHQPLIPLKGLKKVAGLTLSCVAVGWASHGIWSYYMFLLIEQTRHHTPLEAYLRFWPVAPVGLAAALAVSFLLKRLRVSFLMSTAMLCFLLGCLFLVTAPADQGYFPNTFLSVIITPFGMNWSFPTAVILMSNAVHREHQGIAASLVSTMVNYSISTGLGLAGSVDHILQQSTACWQATARRGISG
ncbi:uncharacterized protein LTR77_003945 [Saxophila tyrrhenica]|uniref:Major facilitator superfamily (MFS) profile domain-containing protein n=1 Tax=Saxophila tyrrhenica TaxID=1690608 RepID=A0AAV9PJB8_9PEZI|nr:hypothetical protein LTR77_003945 [Saxophila tyrrhenica]